jgi:hypothetical protein
VIRASLLALLVACGTSSTTAPTTTPTAPAAQPAFGEGPPLVTPGERMTYRVELGGFELARMTLAVGDLTDLAGKKTVVVQGHAKSVGLADRIAAIDDTFTSWIDVETGRSLRFAVDEYETNSKTNIEHTIADLAARSGDKLPITFALGDATPAPEPQKLAYPDAWDYNAFLVALRAWEAPKGTSKSLEVLRSRWLWHIDVTIGGKDNLTTELGDLPALRFDARTYKLTRAGERDTGSDERRFSVWISDDDGRVPLQITARTDYGDVKMRIVDYQPGTGQRLRQ